MENEDYKKDKSRGDYTKRKGHSRHRGAKTFRRGRAIAFLEMMNIKRATLLEQLEQSEFQSIHQILVGELKAIDMVINEFRHLFEIQEGELLEMHRKNNEETESSVLNTKDSVNHDQRGEI